MSAQLTAGRRLVAVGLLSLLLGAGSAGAADAAGIVIEPDHVEPGARDVTLVFRTTDSDPAAPTTGFQLFLPTGRPLVGVTASAPPGWTADLTTTVLPTPAPSTDGPVSEVVSAVSWTATEPRTAAPVDFTLHVDLMPEGAGPVRFRAAGTDAAGNTVEWADSWAEGGPKPAHDALKLPLGAAPRPPEPAGAPSHHHGVSATALPAGAAGPAGIATAAAGLLATAAALTTLVVMLSRRQRRRFEKLGRDG
ncbi:DUF1775 domain-containing protein [Pseudonocardia cypriaca]|uniref:YncI copper-binding domain-containing protein n=1 Tax=Pseudonocardia cypriaca TaxID=882449 RepID=A0A543GAY6_9PSEU|nr:DUF1775 domain-containing protein [Pseudonocardia cypriaca]TQM43154.1 uncharacterized protein FB388_0496 [Pseudonocardia cypriaca]